MPDKVMDDVVIGCDLNSRKVALFVYGGTFLSSTIIEAPRKVTDRPQICAELYARTNEYLKDFASAALFIEEPLVGRNTSASLKIAQIFGVSLAAARIAGVKRIYAVHPSTWKRETISGLPRADHKPHIRAWLSRSHPEMAACAGDDQDLIDSACISLYGRELLRRSNCWQTPDAS